MINTMLLAFQRKIEYKYFIFFNCNIIRKQEINRKLGIGLILHQRYIGSGILFIEFIY